jgi:hypothetical protein
MNVLILISQRLDNYYQIQMKCYSDTAANLTLQTLPTKHIRSRGTRCLHCPFHGLLLLLGETPAEFGAGGGGLFGLGFFFSKHLGWVIGGLIDLDAPALLC